MALTVQRFIYSKVAIPEGKFSDTELKQIAYAVKEEIALSPSINISRWVKHREINIEAYSAPNIDYIFDMVLSDPNIKVVTRIERI